MKVAWTLVLLLLLAACNSTSSGGGQHATVQLRDGSSVTGTVVSSSADEIKITGDDNVTRTLPMSQVRSVEYGDAPAASAAGSSAAPTMAGSSRPAAKAPSRPRPTLDDVTTDTHVVPSGTEVSVQTEETIDGSTAADGQTFAATVTERCEGRRRQGGDSVWREGASGHQVVDTRRKDSWQRRSRARSRVCVD